jgi:hypothetical protein
MEKYYLKNGIKSFFYYLLIKLHNTCNTKCRTFLLIFFTLNSIVSFSQTSSYGFTHAGSDDLDYGINYYEKIINGTILATEYSGLNEANYYANIPIGFTFKFNGKNYTKVGVAPDGYIWFGNTTPLIPQVGEATKPISKEMGVEGVLSALGMSLHGSNMQDANPAISFKTTGTAPFRLFTVEWKDAMSYTNYVNNNAERLNFQISLYETYNVIDFSYDTLLINHSFNDTAEIGIKGATTTDYKNLSLSANDKWWNYTFGNSVNNHCIINRNNGPRTGGMVYEWYKNDDYLAIVSPNGGEHFFAGFAGSTIDLQFQFGLDKAENFEVYFSADSGENYTLIKEAFDPASPANQPSVRVTLPTIYCTECFIKMVGVTTGISDSNDVTFSIALTPGLVTKNSDYKLDIYPNPASSYIHIDANYLAEKAYVLFYDVTGRLVKQVAVEKHAPISIESLNAGLYFLKVVSDKNTYTTKLTISK